MTLRLVNNRTALTYETRDVPNGCFMVVDFRRKRRTVSIDSFIGMANGGLTSTFANRKYKDNGENGRKKMKKSKSLILNSSHPKDCKNRVDFRQTE